jgi:hypothetical protein
LALDLQNPSIEARPSWRLGSPDRQRWFGDLWVIERTRADKDQVRAYLGLAEEVRSAFRAKSTVHNVAAVGDAAVIA